MSVADVAELGAFIDGELVGTAGFHRQRNPKLRRARFGACT